MCSLLLRNGKTPVGVPFIDQDNGWISLKIKRLPGVSRRGMENELQLSKDVFRANIQWRILAIIALEATNQACIG
jgi:hypothetical protein